MQLRPSSTFFQKSSLLRALGAIIPRPTIAIFSLFIFLPLTLKYAEPGFGAICLKIMLWKKRVRPGSVLYDFIILYKKTISGKRKSVPGLWQHIYIFNKVLQLPKTFGEGGS